MHFAILTVADREQIMMIQKKLYRNTNRGMLGGVLAGLAEYFEHDVVWYRLAMLVLVVVTGLMPGILLYLGAWVIIPEKPKIESADKTDYHVRK